MPHNLVKPLIILARIKSYKGIDDYVIYLIEHELESMRNEVQGISDLGEYVIEYIEKIIGPGPYYDSSSASAKTTTATNKKDDESLK